MKTKLLLGILCLGSASIVKAQCNYDQTIQIMNPSLVSTGNVFDFTTVPTNTAGDATVTINVYGDIDGDAGNLEEWTIFDETAAAVGTAGGTGNFADQCASVITAAYTIPQATLDAWAVDGTISFTASDLVGNINLTLCGGDYVEINLVYPLLAVGAPTPDLSVLPDYSEECTATPISPTATDVCGNTISGTSATAFPITTFGSTTITWTYDDGNGNTATQDQIIIVEDITAPIADSISLPDTTGCTITAVAPTATDNCAGAITGTTTDPLTYNVDGTYTVTWTFDDGNGNTSTQTQNIIIVNPLVLTAVVTNEIAGGDGSIDLTATGGAPVLLYDWDNDGTGDNDDTEDLGSLSAGDYTVIVTDGNGCTAQGTYTLISELGIENQSTSFSIYPNPTNGLVLVNLNSYTNTTVLTVRNSLGQVIETFTPSEAQFEIDLSKYSDGIYFVEAADGKSQTTHKLVKN